MSAPPKGHYKYALACDAETTGLFMNTANPDHDVESGQYYQPVSWGLAVIDLDTDTVVDTLYVEIQWDGKSLWNAGAERVHGLSREYLKENGVTEEEAVVQMASLILKYWGPNSHVTLLGHNVATFDLHFMRRMFKRHGIEVMFSQRTLDTSAIMKTTFNTNTSDEAFAMLGLTREGDHNALEDALASADCFFLVRALWNSLVKPTL